MSAKDEDTHLNLPSAILPLSTLLTNMPQSPGKYGSFTPSAISNPSAFKSMSWNRKKLLLKLKPQGQLITSKFKESYSVLFKLHNFRLPLHWVCVDGWIMRAVSHQVSKPRLLLELVVHFFSAGIIKKKMQRNLEVVWIFVQSVSLLLH